MKKSVSPAKIALLDMNLQKTRMHLGVHITIDDPEELENIRRRQACPFPFSHTLFQSTFVLILCIIIHGM
jgi:hypothetical protein